ncbi:MAG: glycosyltransferase family 4 protein [Candidatus Diapherotrites archaeon]|nr:glycosyltransferase family 4 protein [Candidatus Diapherotrites archaeon]
MKVLLLSMDFTVPGMHGGSSHVEGVVRALNALGHEVFLFTRKECGSAEWADQALLHPYYLPFARIGLVRMAQYWMYAFLGALWLSWTKGIDLVWERSRPFGGAGIQTATILHKKSVFELNEPLLYTFAAPAESLKYKVMARLLGSAARRASVVVATHSCMVEGLKPKKVDLTDWGADPELFAKGPHADTIRKAHGLVKGKTALYMGSLRSWHALRETLNAFSLVIEKEPQAKLLFFGQGELSVQCDQWIAEFHLQGHVKKIPCVPHREDLSAFIHAADVCLALYNRNFEWFKKLDYFYSPIKVHEYKACGKPVVASDLGNLRKLVADGKNGFLVNEQDAQETADAILKLLRNPALRKKMGAFNQKEVREKYAWKALVQKTLSLLQE